MNSPVLYKHAIKSKLDIFINLGIGALLCLIVCYIPYLLIDGWGHVEKLSSFGYTTTGIVDNLTADDYSNSVSYHYTVPGSASRQEKLYGKGITNHSYSKGDPISIVYSTRAHGDSMLEEEFQANHTFLGFLYNRAFLVMFGLACIVGAYSKIEYLQELGFNWRLDRDFQIVNAKVLNFSSRKKDYGRGFQVTEYFVNYTFEAMGYTYQMEETIPKWYYKCLTIGQEMKIRYLPEQPEVARIN